jgi:hypothetical protein
MRINYAKKQSDVIAKIRGTFEESDKAKREQRRIQELSKIIIYDFYRNQINKAKEEAD